MLAKIIGIFMIFTVCSAAGMLASAKLSERVSELEGFIGALGMIATEIRYFASPLEELLKKTAETKEYGNLEVFGLCGTELSKTGNFGSSWQHAVAQARKKLSITDDDADVLLRFGSELGATDIEGQLANCARCVELLNERLSSAREDKLRKGRMFSSLGVLGGIFFTVLFI